ncbi:MAG TPA: tetratricopeptide repeat protein [Candidatus Solibacter sp.]|nr:tetratricopeptide repeat protein [Candidatus Solibacter sp.]
MRNPIKLAVAFLLAAAVSAQNSADRQLEAAIHREMVLGDLKGAIEDYRAIVDQSDAPRHIAAGALLHMGECYEKLGQRRQAHEAYSRVVREFESESSVAAEARARIDNAEALPGPANLRFDKDEPGKQPSHGWFVPSMENATYKLAEIHRKGCRGNTACAVLIAPPTTPDSPGQLIQSFSAATFRGKTVRLRAWMKIEAGAPGDHAQIWLSVRGMNRRQGLRAEKPLHADLSEQALRNVAGWTSMEIGGRVDSDAQFLEFGFSAFGHCRVWIDDVSFEVVPETQAAAPVRHRSRIAGQ